MSDEEIARYNITPPSAGDPGLQQSQWRAEVGDYLAQERGVSGRSFRDPEQRRISALVRDADPEAIQRAAQRIGMEGSERPKLDEIARLLGLQLDLMRQSGEPAPIAEAQ